MAHRSAGAVAGWRGLFGGGGGAGNGFADFDTLQFFSGAGGGGGGGSSGVPAGAAGVSGFSLLPGTAGAEPSVSFSWTPPAPAANTAPPTSVTDTTATLTGTVNPNLSEVSDCHFTITPASNAGASFPCAQQPGAGADHMPVTAAATGLAPLTRYTVTPIAVNPHGSTAGEAVTFTTATSSSHATAPLVSALRLSSSRFRRGAHRARLARLRVGTTVMFRLSAAAGVRLTFERAAPGRIVGHRCVRVTRARRHGNRCTRYARVPGAVRLTAPAGVARIRFQGVLDGGRRLAPGAYRLSLVAVDAAGQASPVMRAKFRLIA